MYVRTWGAVMVAVDAAGCDVFFWPRPSARPTRPPSRPVTKSYTAVRQHPRSPPQTGCPHVIVSLSRTVWGPVVTGASRKPCTTPAAPAAASKASRPREERCRRRRPPMVSLPLFSKGKRWSELTCCDAMRVLSGTRACVALEVRRGVVPRHTGYARAAEIECLGCGQSQVVKIGSRPYRKR